MHAAPLQPVDSSPGGKEAGMKNSAVRVTSALPPGPPHNPAGSPRKDATTSEEPAEPASLHTMENDTEPSLLPQ